MSRLSRHDKESAPVPARLLMQLPDSNKVCRAGSNATGARDVSLLPLRSRYLIAGFTHSVHTQPIVGHAIVLH